MGLGGADRSGTEARQRDQAEGRCAPSPGLGPASIAHPNSRELQGLSEEELADLEAEAIEELSEVAQRHANRLPARSERRPLLIKIANLRLGLPQPDVPDPPEGGGVVSRDPKRRSSASVR